MERTKEMWADIHYPPTENEIKYNKMILNYDQLGSIVEDVCVRTRTTHDEIYSKTKDNHVTFSRYLIYYLSQKTGHRLNSIVRYMKSNGYPIFSMIHWFILGATVALALNWSEIHLISKSSALSFCLIGAIKLGALLFVSWALFGHAITMASLTGYLIVMAGVCAYNWVKISQIDIKMTHKLIHETEKEIQGVVKLGKAIILVGEDLSTQAK